MRKELTRIQILEKTWQESSYEKRADKNPVMKKELTRIQFWEKSWQESSSEKRADKNPVKRKGLTRFQLTEKRADKNPISKFINKKRVFWHEKKLDRVYSADFNERVEVFISRFDNTHISKSKQFLWKTISQ